MSRNSSNGKENADPEYKTSRSPITSNDPARINSPHLRTLAPRYEEHFHSNYVRHLLEALDCPDNKNIALTGAYGSGKSSILSQFVATLKARDLKVVRISISTLGSDSEADITNRIQKELVKHFVYRAKPGLIKRSRFARRKELTWPEQARDALIMTIVGVGLLLFCGLLPEVDANSGWDGRISYPIFFGLIFVLTLHTRSLIGNRMIDSVGAGGTTISLCEMPETYFDEYLDEIVAYFEGERPNVVVFEDLDRFDDPQIFDSLRELNTLLNSTHAFSNQEDPVRFVYAIKDSLFEKLENHLQVPQPPASQPQSEHKDLVVAGLDRTNHTKFFEIVIPVVPFLTHSNAKDLLNIEVEALGCFGTSDSISRAIIQLVAQHITDMRLMTNICNEFTVFAEHLLWVEESQRAPGITADTLFALVAYKNLHPSDFERLAYRGSDLDILEQTRHQLVDFSVSRFQAEKRKLNSQFMYQEGQAELAEELGDRLRLHTEKILGSVLVIQFGKSSFEAESIDSVNFWRAVSKLEENEITVKGNSNSSLRMTVDELAVLCPESRQRDRWLEITEEELSQRRKRIDEQIEKLRGADFKDLLEDSNLKFKELSFGEHLSEILKSDLAKELVRHGYIDRYYAEYSSIFYSGFLGVDVSNFFRNAVGPNQMNIHASFASEDSIANVIEQAPADFTSSRSALNIAIVNYLLSKEPTKALQLVQTITSSFDEVHKEFLQAFLDDDSNKREELVKLMTEAPWNGVFQLLAEPGFISESDSWHKLINTALKSVQNPESYKIDDSVARMFYETHSSLEVFTRELSGSQAQVVYQFAKSARLKAEDLSLLSPGMRDRFIEDGCYSITLPNLRILLRIDESSTPTLDLIHGEKGYYGEHCIWDRVVEDLDLYLDSIEADPSTDWAIESSEILVIILEHLELGRTTQEERLMLKRYSERLLELTAPEVLVTDLEPLPIESWSAIARTRRLSMNLNNLDSYVRELGIDEHISALLDELNAVQISDDSMDRNGASERVAIAILNDRNHLSAPRKTEIVAQFHQGHLPITEVEVTNEDLLAECLRKGLFEDSEETFAHFLAQGWEYVSSAFKVSKEVRNFLGPQLLKQHLSDFLKDSTIAEDLKNQVLMEIDRYLNSLQSDSDTLSAILRSARDLMVHLGLSALTECAPHTSDPEHVLWQLSQKLECTSGQEVFNIFSSIGSAYDLANAESGQKVVIPKTASTNDVLRKLKDEGFITLPPGGSHSHRTVILP